MPINASNLRWYQSERMTDEDDGGGQMSSVEIVPGIENQVFDDLSDVDRAAGDVSLRKIYAAVASLDADKYLDAGVVVFRQPTDPDVSVLVFSTGDYYDERADMQNLLESSITRGALYTGWLWGDHIAGQRAVSLWQRESYPLPSVGVRLNLVSKSGSIINHEEYLWVTRIVAELVERVDGNGPYRVRQVVLELAEGLRYDYTGTEPSRVDPSTAGAATLIYNTKYNPEVVNLCGIRPLVAEADAGSYIAQIDALYSPLIPTAMAESALADINPGGDSPTLIAGATTRVWWEAPSGVDIIGPNKTLYLGASCYPGTLDITCWESDFYDQGGQVYEDDYNSVVGTINYESGIISWSAGCPDLKNYLKLVHFLPAARPLRVADTASLAVTIENRGFVWVATLTPIPQPGSLRVSYRANDAWYTLSDGGTGILRGVDSSYGTGSINYASGTVTLTTGAMPDPESEILFAWGVPINYTARGGASVAPPKLSGQTSHPGVAPGTFTATWSVEQVEFSATDAGDGTIGGDADGTISYSTGAWEMIFPTVLPMGTEIAIEYEWGDPIEETFTPSRNGNGDLPITLNVVPRVGTVEVEWDMALADLEDQLNLTEEHIPWVRPPNLGGNW